MTINNLAYIRRILIKSKSKNWRKLGDEIYKKNLIKFINTFREYHMTFEILGTLLIKSHGTLSEYYSGVL